MVAPSRVGVEPRTPQKVSFVMCVGISRRNDRSTPSAARRKPLARPVNMVERGLQQVKLLRCQVCGTAISRANPGPGMDARFRRQEYNSAMHMHAHHAGEGLAPGRPTPAVLVGALAATLALVTAEFVGGY